VFIIKRRDLDKEVSKYGFSVGNGGEHDYYINGKFKIAVPRHREIKEPLAKAIINKVKNYSTEEK
jgi:hypothetical protein